MIIVSRFKVKTISGLIDTRTARARARIYVLSKNKSFAISWVSIYVIIFTFRDLLARYIRFTRFLIRCINNQGETYRREKILSLNRGLRKF